MYLLDTNVVSEVRRIRSGRADVNVARWIGNAKAAELFLSAVTVEELEIGILGAERRDPVQGSLLRNWLTGQVLPRFAGRILPVDLAVAVHSARLHVPNPIPIRDGYIAATALVHGMTVVTRNVADFEPKGVPVLNPWEA
jgi:predicted nucleic acid-binding protein